MKKIITFDSNPELDRNVPSLINVDFFTSKKSALNVDYVPVENKKAKRGRPVGSKNTVDVDQLLTGDDNNLPMHQSTEPYSNSYEETKSMLKNSVCQIDILQNEVKGELDQIRASKTLKRKYDYLGVLASTMSTLIGTKVTAIREINKTITDCHNLEMKRVKDLKMDAAGQDDNKSIMDTYNSYISMPVGSYTGPNTYNPPSHNEMALLNSGVLSTDMYQNNNQGYSVDPSVNRMILQEDPNIKTVVLYNSSTGDRSFDVIDTRTGESIPGMEKPDSMFLNDITIDTRNGIARNTNMDTSYTLIEMSNPNINKY